MHSAKHPPVKIRARLLSTNNYLMPATQAIGLCRSEFQTTGAINVLLPARNQSYVLIIGFSALSLYSRMSPGWQSRALQIDSRVLNLIALALPVFRMERFESVRSTFSESSFSDIFRLAIITSRFTIIGIIQTVKSFSFWISTPLEIIVAMTYTTAAINI